MLKPSFLTNVRHRLARSEAHVQLAILGVLSGIGAGFLIVLFRFSFEIPQFALLPDHNPENYEGLPLLLRFSLPLTGALLIAAVFHYLSKAERRVGVGHVIERLHHHQGYLPLKAMVAQFAVGAISILSGHSAGREGAAVHLGAASSSQLGQFMKLPNNTIRILLGCGTAAAISASFNTPIAGVIFAMEVVMMEYTINTFVPVILASVSGAIITRIFYGQAPAFDLPVMTMASLYELPFLLFMGVTIGCFAAIFNHTAVFVARKSTELNLWMRLGLAGVITGVAAMMVPEIMGIGYDTVTEALNGRLTLALLITIFMAKLFVTAICAGLGLPAGLIGPSLVIGACCGAATGIMGASLMPDFASNAGFYSILGMGAMMGAVINAPLAALTALMEMTANTHIVMPSMLVIVISNLIAREYFNSKPIFTALLETQGIQHRDHPVAQWLDRSGVAEVMETQVLRQHYLLSLADAQSLLQKKPTWIVIDKENTPVALLPTSDLASYLSKVAEETEDDQEPEPLPLDKTINLLEIAAQRKDLAAIGLQATLREAVDMLNTKQVEALYVERNESPATKSFYGIVTRLAIENFYSYRP
ncbi:MAG TPA: chloride channel protein [Pseudomonadales bacterium]